MEIPKNRNRQKGTFMIRRSASLTVLLAVIAIAIAGCGPGPGETTNKPPRLENASSIYLVNPIQQKLIAYNRDTHRVTGTSAEGGSLYYSFTPQTEYFSAGSSDKFGFEVLSIKNRSVKSLNKAKGKQGYFPLATDGHEFFYIATSYSRTGVQTGNSIVQRDANGTMTPYFSVPLPINAGAIANGRLFYSVYNEKTDKYSVYSFQIGNHSVAPRLERTDLADGSLYSHRGKVLYSNEGIVTDGNVRYSCSSICDFYDTPNITITIEVDKSGTAIARVFNGVTGKLIGSVEDAVGYSVEEDGVHLYAEGKETFVRAS